MLTRDRVVHFLLRLYRQLLFAYPSNFRHRFGPEMIQVLRDRCREESEQGNTTHMISLCAHTFLDLLTTALRERGRDCDEQLQHRFHSFTEFLMVFLLTASLTVGLHWILWSSITAVLARHPVVAVVASDAQPDRSFWELTLAAIGVIVAVTIFACANFRMIRSRRQRSSLAR